MLPRIKQLTTSLGAAAALLLIVLGVPAALVATVGWPLPTGIPSPGGLITAIEQRNVAGEVVVNSLAIVVWLLWAQLMWALTWELVVNGRRLAQGLRTRPAPFVAGPLNQLAVKLVSGAFAASVVVTSAATTLSLPSAPTLALTAVGEQIDQQRSQTMAAPEEADSGSAGLLNQRASSTDPGPGWLVKEGDSLWSIAESTFGDGGRSADVLALNPQLASARSVRPGMVLIMPVGAPVPADRASTATGEHTASAEIFVPAADVEIEVGDNLWRLSEARLDTVVDDPPPSMVADHLAEVVEQNVAEIDNPDLIHPGQIVAFPQIGQPTGESVEGGVGSAPAEQPAVAAAPTTTTTSDIGPGADTGDPLPGSQPDAEIDDVADRALDDAVDDGSPEPDDDEALSSPLPLVFGVGGALLAAGALDLARRRWRYRLAHRSPGKMPRGVDDELRSTEGALRREADGGSRRWLDEALGSLALRPVWEGEDMAQPMIARLRPEYLEVAFDRPDPMAAPLPWTTDDDGHHWRLDRIMAVDATIGVEQHLPLPGLVTIGPDLMINLEAFGVLGVEGPGTDPMAMVRSFVHELATSSSAGAIDVRSTIPLVGVGSYDLVRIQSPIELSAELPSWLRDVEEELARRSSSNAYGHRLATELDPIGPVIVFADEAGCRAMPEVLDYAARRNLPLAVVVVGPTGATNTEHVVSIGPQTARLEPWGIDFEPQMMTADAARRLGELLEQTSNGGEEPLVAETELSASVTDIRRGRAPNAASNADEAQRAESDGGVGQQVTPRPEPNPSERLAETETETKTEPDLDSETASEVPEPEPDDVMVRVLGPVDSTGHGEDLTSQQLSLVTFLACNGPSSRELVIDALWDGQVISKSRFPNLLAETRAKIGRHHFPEARDGRYELRGVTTDLAQFERNVLGAQRQDSPTAATTLKAALELVRGVPLTPPARRFWSWVDGQSHVAARVESMVADTAARLARLEQDRGAIEGARWACERGLLASPTDETLVVLLTEVYLAMGKVGLARRLVDSWEERIGQLDCGEPSDEPRKRLAG